MCNFHFTTGWMTSADHTHTSTLLAFLHATFISVYANGSVSAVHCDLDVLWTECSWVRCVSVMVVFCSFCFTANLMSCKKKKKIQRFWSVSVRLLVPAARSVPLVLHCCLHLLLPLLLPLVFFFVFFFIIIFTFFVSSLCSLSSLSSLSSDVIIFFFFFCICVR